METATVWTRYRYETVVASKPSSPYPSVIPAKAGIQERVGRGRFSRCAPPPPLDSRFRGNDGGGTGTVRVRMTVEVRG